MHANAQDKLSEVSARSKEYENIALRHDPAYERVDEFITLLIQFIRDRGFIIYGGLAIDYALRLFGDKIYPDDLLQIDYDFFAQDNVSSAYDLADAFYDLAINGGHDPKLCEGIRAIGALHVKTMRVDIGDNHFIADLTYCPQDVFAALPFLEYQGIKIIHPDMQRIDIHSSLSFPYDYAPFEVIFNRWKKDITRFNLLDKYYPINGCVDALSCISHKGKKDAAEYKDAVNAVITTHSLPSRSVFNGMRKYVLSGFAAYGAMYTAVKKRHGSPPADIIEGVFEISGDNVTIAGGEVELVHFNMDKCAEELNLAHIHKYNPYINLTSETLMGSYDGPEGALKTIIHSTQGRLLSVISIDLSDDNPTDIPTNITTEHTEHTKHTYRVVCAQYLLKYFLSTYYRMKMDPTYVRAYSKEVFLNYYVSLMKLIQFEDSIDSNNTTTILTQETNVSILITGLSVSTYGSDNISLSKTISISRILADMKMGEVPPLPSNYYPKNNSNKQRPKFDYSVNDIYLESGEEISNE